MDLSFLPAVNACLNATATVLLVRGRMLVRRGEIDAHRRTMLTAFGISAVFLVFYVLHKWSKDFENTPFEAEGALRVLYLVILFTHLTLAMAVPVMAILLIRFGLADRRGPHRRLARWAWPIWMYVSVTGVVIYVMLYHLNPTTA